MTLGERYADSMAFYGGFCSFANVGTLAEERGESERERDRTEFNIVEYFFVCPLVEFSNYLVFHKSSLI